MVFFIWYGLVRFALETLRSDNWTFFGIPTAQLVSLAFVVVALAVLIWRHRPGHATTDDPPSYPEVATWGALSGIDWSTRPIDEPWAHAGDLSGGVAPDAAEYGIGPAVDDVVVDDVGDEGTEVASETADASGSDRPPTS
jgi:hypothetical protein